MPGGFSAGNDLADFLKAAESAGGLNRPALRFLPALVRCNKPMVAAVSGGRGLVRAYEDAIAFEPFADPRGYTGRSVFAQQARSNRPYPMACREL